MLTVCSFSSIYKDITITIEILKLTENVHCISACIKKNDTNQYYLRNYHCYLKKPIINAIPFDNEEGISINIIEQSDIISPDNSSKFIIQIDVDYYNKSLTIHYAPTNSSAIYDI